jgi:hypothetical protein
MCWQTLTPDAPCLRFAYTSDEEVVLSLKLEGITPDQFAPLAQVYYKAVSTPHSAILSVSHLILFADHPP